MLLQMIFNILIENDIAIFYKKISSEYEEFFYLTWNKLKSMYNFGVIVDA